MQKCKVGYSHKNVKNPIGWIIKMCANKSPTFIVIWFDKLINNHDDEPAAAWYIL